MKILCIFAIGIVIISTCFYQHSVEASDAQTDYETGLRYHNSHDYGKALKWLSKAADQGNADAQGLLGFMYYKGEGVTQNYAEALKWFRKAVDQGDADTQGLLSVIYYYGEGYTQNYVESLKWARKGANQGNAVAQWVLGLIYYHGEGGVSKDPIEAKNWFRKAAAQGDKVGLYLMKQLAELGYLKQGPPPPGALRKY